MGKLAFCNCKNKGAGTGQLHRRISAFVFATYIEQSLSYLNPKFEASSHLVLPGEVFFLSHSVGYAQGNIGFMPQSRARG